MLKNNQINPLKEIIPKLTKEKLITLTKHLPIPNSVWKINNIIFKIYKVKDLFDPQWLNETLYKLLLHARSSYYIYGDRPPLDEYDAKSASYLIQTTYQSIEEWLSVRITPYHGTPINESDLAYFLYNGHKIDYYLQENFFTPQKTYLDYTVAIDRICAIRPYCIASNYKKSDAIIPLKQKFAGISYALIIKQSLKDYLEEKPYLYATTILNNKMRKKSLTVEWRGIKLPIKFSPAYKLLGFKNSRPISLNRLTHNKIIYKFPSYFLNLMDLMKLMKKLNNKKILPNRVIKNYINERLLTETTRLGEIPLEKFHKIGKLLSVNGKINGSDITGEELRRLIDQEVSDNHELELKITEISTIKKNIDSILSKMNAKLI